MDAAIPLELRSRNRWVRWRKQGRNGKVTKVPRLASGRGHASTRDPGTWTSFDEVSKSTHGDGMGFVLNGDGIGAIDLDDCFSDGNLEPWAQEIVDANGGTFMELSQSGNGLHIWGYLPKAGGIVIRDGRKIEVYSDVRYIALGTPLAGSSRELRELTAPQR